MEKMHLYLDKKSTDKDCRYTLASETFKVNENNDNQYIKNIQEGSPKNPLIVLGINPSTADETKSDTTTNKVKKFVDLHDEYDGWIMINIFALIETDSKTLSGKVLSNLYKKSLSIDVFNQVINFNIDIIKQLINHFEEPSILLGFGNKVLEDSFIGMLFIELYDELKTNKAIKWCLLSDDDNLVITKDGMPNHLSRISIDEKSICTKTNEELEDLVVDKIRESI